MRTPQGYLTVADPEAPTIERDTFTCAHCQKIVIVAPMGAVTDPGKPQDIGGFCRACYKNVCGRCADSGVCRPFEKWLEEQESRDRLRKSILG